MVDSYYHEAQQDSYLSYKLYGGGMGYENYMSQQSHTAFRELSEALRADAPGKQIGMLTVPVWANRATDAEGRDSSCLHSQVQRQCRQPLLPAGRLCGLCGGQG